jgi:predicted CXXCH cytochrome family protein
MRQNRTFKCLVFISISIFFSTPVIADNKYVGSEKCASCHKTIYDLWKDSKHNKGIQDVSSSNDNVIADWNGTVKLKAGRIPEVSLKLSRSKEGDYLATLVNAKYPSLELTYKVVRIHGTGWLRGQRYQIKIDKDYYFLPMNWNPDSSTWSAFGLDWWYDEDGYLHPPVKNRSLAMTCSGCHHTGMSIKKVYDTYEVSYAELNIGCEKCHGPGVEHIASKGAKEKIINPRNLAYDRGLDVCTQCHSMAASVPNGIFSFPWNDKDNKPYPIGEPLINYYKPGGEFSPNAAAEGVSLRTEHSLSKSKHYSAKTSCFDCHNPHGGAAQYQIARSDIDNSLCLSCHGKEKEFASPSKIMKHTKHSYSPVSNAVSRCTSCHQIQSRSKMMNTGVPGRGASAGFLEVIKPKTSLEMFKINPEGTFLNSCNGCHKDWSGNELGYTNGAKAYEAKFAE